MANDNAAWGIDFGDGSLRIVKMKIIDDRPAIECFDIVEAGLWKDANGTGNLKGAEHNQVHEVLDKLTLKFSIKPREKVAVSPLFNTSALISKTVGNQTYWGNVESAWINLPPVEKGKLKDILQYEAEHRFSGLRYLVWDYQMIEEAEEDAEWTVAIFALWHKFVDEIVMILKDHNFRADIVQAHTIALYNFLSFEHEIAANTAITCIEPKKADLFVVFDERGGFRAASVPIPFRMEIEDVSAYIDQAKAVGVIHRLDVQDSHIENAVAGLNKIGLANGVNIADFGANLPLLRTAIGLALQGLGVSSIKTNFLKGERSKTDKTGGAPGLFKRIFSAKPELKEQEEQPEEESVEESAEYREEEIVDNVLEEITTERLLHESQQQLPKIDIEKMTDLPLEEKLINLIILQSVQDKASEVFFEPFEDEFVIKYKIDGVLYEVVPPPKQLAAKIVSYVRNLAGMEDSQNGDVRLLVGNQIVDIIVTIIPSAYGESIQFELRTPSTTPNELNEIMSKTEIASVTDMLNKGSGLILLASPIKSGKTVTLHSLLNHLNKPYRRIALLRDKKERLFFNGVTEINVVPDNGQTFGEAISRLRNNCDVIALDGRYEKDVLDMAAEIATEGVMILMTFSANDAASAIVKLMSYGMNETLLAEGLTGIISQRLVKTICNNCKKPYRPDDKLKAEFGTAIKPGIEIYHGTGCDWCSNTGYKGRIAIFQMIASDSEIRRAIEMGENVKAAVRKRTRSLRDLGMEKVIAGLTTVEEIRSIM